MSAKENTCVSIYMSYWVPSLIANWLLLKRGQQDMIFDWHTIGWDAKTSPPSMQCPSHWRPGSGRIVLSCRTLEGIVWLNAWLKFKNYYLCLFYILYTTPDLWKRKQTQEINLQNITCYIQIPAPGEKSQALLSVGCQCCWHVAGEGFEGKYRTKFP